MPIVWNLMDADRSGTVSYTEFVNQVYKLRNKDPGMNIIRKY